MKWFFHALLCVASKSAFPVFCLPGLRISGQRDAGLPLGSAFAQTDLQVYREDLFGADGPWPQFYAKLVPRVRKLGMCCATQRALC